MTLRRTANRRPGVRGQTLVEFSLVAFLSVILLLSIVEISRMALVYTTVANAARAGARYSIVHGGTRTGSGVDGPSGPAQNPDQVLTVIRNFASAGLLSTSNLIITVNYPGASNAPGQLVSVTVIYPYDPLTTYFPLQVRLGSMSEGVIAF
ncbi:MAG: pilus assembly protein [Bryobacterales bacterium]|nr:pilus assembly protein [Bryobacterales bacterium]